MATKQSTVDFILEQIAEAGVVNARKMFGEYAIYCNERVVALVCDDQLFVKPTDEVKALLANYEEKPPYPGAKPYIYISGDYWEDKQWLTMIITKTAEVVPLPKLKKKK